MQNLVDTLIIGGGQAGLALSYHLVGQKREHILLEKADSPASAWRDDRWDSFTLVTPNWTFRLPGAEYDGKKCGTLGALGCFSFFSNKNLVTGEGVALLDQVAEEPVGLRGQVDGLAAPKQLALAAVQHELAEARPHGPIT